MQHVLDCVDGKIDKGIQEFTHVIAGDYIMLKIGFSFVEFNKVINNGVHI